MRINKITLNNFRIYKGLNTIEFKPSKSNHNIIIVAGQNGFGKTTFLSALVWAFYGKLIGDVDDKFKRDVYEAGGYKKYANSLLNRDIKREPETKKTVSVEVELSDIYIPSVPCHKIVIYREYNVTNETEYSNIIIDGYENELTKEVGSDIFINDFILPREIAKFFLFDAEKIVSLAEIKTKSEKKNLSRAYSEVLGISKYENLKNNLENLRIKLRKKSATANDREKLNHFQEEVRQLENLIQLNEAKINSNDTEIEKLKGLSEQLQEKLIREGNNMSVEELIKQKNIRDNLKQQNIEIKSKLKELIDLAPFAIAGNKIKQLYKQIIKESKDFQKQVDIDYIRSKIELINKKFEEHLKKRNLPRKLSADFKSILTESFNINESQEKLRDKVLLDLTKQQTNEFFAIYDNLRSSYLDLFRHIVKEEKDNRILLSKTLRLISDAEAKDKDILSIKYKSEKSNIDNRIKELGDEQNKLHQEIGAYQQNIATKSKIISELIKTVRLDAIDEEKDQVTSRLIDELSEFILKFKSEKKQSLEIKIKRELHRLMHKQGFISNVKVELTKDIIEIELLDRNNELIEKDTLSKGEQQLYATALLKSLVDESGIQFPVFIDSPLQKFDKKHSNNIITEFYPSISKQVILFPLLEKELTEKEYTLLLPYISQTFIISNNKGSSLLVEYESSKLFTEIEKKDRVHPH